MPTIDTTRLSERIRYEAEEITHRVTLGEVVEWALSALEGQGRGVMSIAHRPGWELLAADPFAADRERSRHCGVVQYPPERHIVTLWFFVIAARSRSRTRDLPAKTYRMKGRHIRPSEVWG